MEQGKIITLHIIYKNKLCILIAKIIAYHYTKSDI